MKENKLLIISILILSLSIFVGSLWIGYSIKNNNENNKQNYSSYFPSENKALITDEEAAEYLNLPLDKFKTLVSNLEIKRKKEDSTDNLKFIPFIQIDGVKYYSKPQIDIWVLYNIMSWEDIKTYITE